VKAFWVRNWFVLALPVTVALASLVPSVGANGGPLHPEISTKLAVAAIFLAQGLTLPTAALRQGAGRWRLHLLVQSFTFLLFPLLGLALDRFWGRVVSADLQFGFLFLCVLPSTVSSSVVQTSLAGGNTVGAIFNAALSNVIGIVVTPLWVTWLMKQGGTAQPLGYVFRDIAFLLLAPMALGQGLRWFLGAWADRRKRALAHACSALILWLVFAAFCNPVQQGLWKTQDRFSMLVAALGAAGVLGLAMGAVELLVRMARLDRGDRIAATFCAPQKTIAAGIPLAKAILGSHPGLGLILLPVLLYHLLQLLVGGILAERFARAGHLTKPH
jgi:sodium/bile acid cotransporter 7